MHVAKAPVQLALKRQMHGRRDSVLQQLTGAEVMVKRENTENTR